MQIAVLLHCIIGKKTKVKFDITIHRTEGILDYVHTGVWGPTKMASLGDMHYFVSFIDDFSKRCWVCTMRHCNASILRLQRRDCSVYM